MSGECDTCGEHALDCQCNIRAPTNSQECKLEGWKGQMKTYATPEWMNKLLGREIPPQAWKGFMVNTPLGPMIDYDLLRMKDYKVT